MKFIAAYAVSTWAAADFLNHPGFNWLGLISRKPITEDYVPLLPWLGVMWWGMAAGQWLLAQRPAWVQAALPGAAAPLSWLGRWSLSWYMLHQPVMIGALMAVKALTPFIRPWPWRAGLPGTCQLLLLQLLRDLRLDLFQLGQLRFAHVVQADHVPAKLALDRGSRSSGPF
jgi:uncharacterized membrane protein